MLTLIMGLICAITVTVIAACASVVVFIQTVIDSIVSEDMIEIDLEEVQPLYANDHDLVVDYDHVERGRTSGRKRKWSGMKKSREWKDNVVNMLSWKKSKEKYRRSFGFHAAGIYRNGICQCSDCRKARLQIKTVKAGTRNHRLDLAVNE